MIKLLLWVARLFVGVLFIFSGLIKANDAIGFSYKLQEYFEKFSEVFSGTFFGFLSYPMDWMAHIALPLSMIIVIGEVVLGILLITGSYIKKVSWYLLGMIVFFTILTFVSWKFKLVESCGCFGEAIPLTPFESFIKDLILLVLIIFIFIFRKNINSIFSLTGDKLVFWTSSVLGLLFTWYCYQHLPIKDFRPYAPGKHLLPQMEPVEGNPLTMYKLKHKETGEIVQFSDYPTDYQSWDYIENSPESGELTLKKVRIKSTNQETMVFEIPEVFGSQWEVIGEVTENYLPDEDPKIMQLSANKIDSSEEDMLLEMLNDSSYYFWLILRDLDALGNFEMFDDGWKFMPNSFGEEIIDQVKKLYIEGGKNGVKFYGLCSEGRFDKIKAFRHEAQIPFEIYSCDDTELKTMIRSSPGLFLLKGDLIIDKWHHNDFPEYESIQSHFNNTNFN
jgi:uncharacterized membrane protein YphA (DoxX/SURF4 family)